MQNLKDSHKSIINNNFTRLVIASEDKESSREFFVKGFVETLTLLNNQTKNEVTKIKISEIISIIQPPAKNAKINDNDLVDLLQYYDLINELETVNV